MSLSRSLSFTVCLSPCLTLTLPCLPVAMTSRQVDECVLVYVCLHGDRLGLGDGYAYAVWSLWVFIHVCVCGVAVLFIHIETSGNSYLPLSHDDDVMLVGMRGQEQYSRIDTVQTSLNPSTEHWHCLDPATNYKRPNPKRHGSSHRKLMMY